MTTRYSRSIVLTMGTEYDRKTGVGKEKRENIRSVVDVPLVPLAARFWSAARPYSPITRPKSVCANL